MAVESGEAEDPSTAAAPPTPAAAAPDAATAAVPATVPSPGRPGRLSAQVNFWSTLLTAFTAVAALIISGITYVQLNTRAEITMTMPYVIRLTAGWFVGRGGAVSVIISPTFSVERKSDVQAFVTAASLELAPPAGSGDVGSVSLPWQAVVELGTTQDGRTIIAKTSDASPVLVSAEAAQTPSMEFLVNLREHRKLLTPGRWTGRLTVQRLAQEPIVQDFCMSFPDYVVNPINSTLTADVTAGSGIQEIVRYATAQEPDPSCYGAR